MDRLNSNQHSFTTTAEASAIGSVRVTEWVPEEDEEQPFDPNRPRNFSRPNLVRTYRSGYVGSSSPPSPPGMTFEGLYRSTFNNTPSALPCPSRNAPETATGPLSEVIKQEQAERKNSTATKD